MTGPHDWVLASSNAGKLTELATLLAGLGLNLHSEPPLTAVQDAISPRLIVPLLASPMPFPLSYLATKSASFI